MFLARGLRTARLQDSIADAMPVRRSAMPMSGRFGSAADPCGLRSNLKTTWPITPALHIRRCSGNSDGAGPTAQSRPNGPYGGSERPVALDRHAATGSDMG